MQTIHILTTGGTIDKIYFDALSEFTVGDTAIDTILRDANVSWSYQLTSLLKKDSLELTPADRDVIFKAARSCPQAHILITHGTDTMIQTAQHLKNITDKTIVLTGAMQPASLRATDAIFNIGFAIAATTLLPPGIYIAMNGQVFSPDHVHKDRTAQMFVATQSGG